jgi:hypothetical protein
VRSFIYGQWPHGSDALRASYAETALPMVSVQIEKVGEAGGGAQRGAAVGPRSGTPRSLLKRGGDFSQIDAQLPGVCNSGGSSFGSPENVPAILMAAVDPGHPLNHWKVVSLSPSRTRENSTLRDSKSVARKGVGVQVPPGAPKDIKDLEGTRYTSDE